MRRQLVTLTGIRGVAAMWVVLFHGYAYLGPLLGGPDRIRVPIIRDGYLGVDLFFILSGFVLSLAYSERIQKDFKSGIVEFFFARVWRIFPLHWFSLAIFVLLVEAFPENFWGPGPFTLGALVASAALVQDWIPSTALAWNHPSWSLSAEWAAYLLFPFLIVAIGLLRDRTLAFCLALVSLARAHAVPGGQRITQPQPSGTSRDRAVPLRVQRRRLGVEGDTRGCMEGSLGRGSGTTVGWARFAWRSVRSSWCSPSLFRNFR